MIRPLDVTTRGDSGASTGAGNSKPSYSCVFNDIHISGGNPTGFAETDPRIPNKPISGSPGTRRKPRVCPTEQQSRNKKKRRPAAGGPDDIRSAG